MSINSSGLRCPSCQTPNQMNASFCLNCGASLTQATSPEPTASPYQPPSSADAPPMAGEFLYAGFWKRFVAWFIDGIIFNFLAFAIAIWGFSSAISFSDPLMMSESLAVFYLFYYPGWWLYFAIQESSSAQATLGKRLLGIKVTDMQGHQMSFAHAAGRQLSGVVTSMTFLIGYLLAAFTRRKQALHDLIASAVVVNKNFGPNQITLVNQNPPAGMSIGGIIAVVAIVLIIPIGLIIAAISIPAYQDYAVRAQVLEASQRANTAQTQIVLYAIETGYWPQNFEQANISSDDMRTDKYYIQMETDGVMTVYFQRPQIVAGGQLRYTPELQNSGGYEWRCESIQLEYQYVPASCR